MRALWAAASSLALHAAVAGVFLAARAADVPAAPSPAPLRVDGVPAPMGKPPLRVDLVERGGAPATVPAASSLPASSLPARAPPRVARAAPTRLARSGPETAPAATTVPADAVAAVDARTADPAKEMHEMAADAVTAADASAAVALNASAAEAARARVAGAANEPHAGRTGAVEPATEAGSAGTSGAPGAATTSGASGISGPGEGTDPGAKESAGRDQNQALTRALRRSAQRCYPAAASRFRLTGEATVHFCVEPGGGHRALRLVGSSGHGLLDRAALACVVPGAVPLPAPARCFTVPVRFEPSAQPFGSQAERAR